MSGIGINGSPLHSINNGEFCLVYVFVGRNFPYAPKPRILIENLTKNMKCLNADAIYKLSDFGWMTYYFPIARAVFLL